MFFPHVQLNQSWNTLLFIEQIFHCQKKVIDGFVKNFAKGFVMVFYDLNVLVFMYILSWDNFFILRRGSFIVTYTKFSEKLTFLTSWYAHASIRIRGSDMLVFRNILPAYSMNDSRDYIRQLCPENCFVLLKLDLLWFTVTTGLKCSWSDSTEFLSRCQYLI